MRRVLHLGLACAWAAAALGVVSPALAQDGGGWPTGDAASSDSGGAACAYGNGGFGDGGTPPSTMSPNAILAYYCGDAEMQCATSPIAFDKTIELADWLPDWDTGWIPQNFEELQVRFILQIPAETQVKLAGKFQTTWPDALTLATPGDRTGGFLKFDYGVVIHGWGKIDISVLGYHITWQGDLPYVPQVDFHLLGMKQFDAWAFEPNSVSASAFTPQVELFSINLLGLAGIPDEIAEGGVRLNIKGELQTTYITEKIIVTPSVVPITTENGATLDNYVGGAFVEYDVHPEGKVSYDGIIHLIPSFYVEVLGQDFQIPFYDYPVSLTDIVGKEFSQQFSFDKVTVHVPLPDIQPLSKQVYDFGKVSTGSGEKIKIPIPNAGEGKARAHAEVEESMKNVFKVMTQTVYVDPCASDDITIRFTPKKAGKYETTLTIFSNDPDLPSQTVTIKGEATGEDLPEYPDGGDGPPDPEEDGGLWASGGPSGDDGGCGCRAAGSDAGSAAALAALGLVALAASRRRGRNHDRKGD